MKNKVYKKIKDILKIFGVVLLYVAIQIILGAIFNKYLHSKNVLISGFTELGIYLFCILLLGLIFFKPLKRDIKNFKKEYIKIGFKNWAKGLLLMIISNIYIIYFTKVMAGNEAANRSALASSPLINCIIMVIIAPLLEEIVFRLNIKEKIKNKWIGCTLSALLFGSLHLIAANSAAEMLYIIPYGSLGFFLAKSVYETDNIYSSVICHMTHNALAILIIFIGG